MAKQTFVCDFGDGLTCTTVVNHTRLFQGRNHVVGMEWSRRPTPDMMGRILPPYREWIHSINQAAVEKTGKTILYALQTTGTLWEIWSYRPGIPPTLQQIMDSERP